MYIVLEGLKYNVDALDTWNMTVAEMEGIYSGMFTINGPSRKYIAVRIYNVDIATSFETYQFKG
jgi:hypothetical protein